MFQAMSYADIEKRRAYDRAYHARRSPEAKARKIELQRKRILELQGVLLRIKAERGCADCGEKDPIVLDFDHRDRKEKHFQIGDTARFGWSKKKLLEEVEKCDVVCANCHRRRTAVQLGWYAEYTHPTNL
jgi:hypothetical protein